MGAKRYRNFHPGEVAFQADFGVDTDAFDVGVERAFRPELSDNEVRFVDGLTFSVATSIDGGGRPWVSPLFAPAGGLFEVVDRTTVLVRPEVADGDPLLDNVEATGELGVLYFCPSRRRRAKSLGRATLDDGAIRYTMHRNFGLCTKYICKRAHSAGAAAATAVGEGSDVRTSLTQADREQLAASDTIYLGSHHTEHGADATHRGGPAGFVSVVDDTMLLVPEYLGNGMFNTLGNLLLDDRVALTTVDLRTGRTLQVTGRGATEPSPPDDAMSERSILIAITEVRVNHAAVGEWTDLEAFDHRPGLLNPATPFR
ncbi:MAG: pyridoxamine 5'-phosphate oxidase family protein [Actinomycetota bacterium]